MLGYTSTGAIESDVARIEELKGRLDRRGPELLGWRIRLRRELEAEAVAASTSMEGVPVTVAEVVRILAGDSLSSVSPQHAELVRGYRDAMRHAFARAEAPDFAWNPELLLALHGMVMAADRRAWPGRFRDAAVYVVNDRTSEVIYEAPLAQEVPKLVGELCDFADSSELPAPVVSALVHVGIARIHPFKDGNGRVGRIVASLAMYRAGYRAMEFTTLEEWWGRHLADYYGALRDLGPSFDAEKDVTSFVAAHVAAQRLQIEARGISSEVERAVWVALENAAAADLSMPSRAADALFDAFFGRGLTNRYYRSIAGVSTATAANDLVRMQVAGLLEAEGAGRSRSYAGTFRLLARVASEAGVPVLADAGASLDTQRATILRGIAELLREQRELRSRG
ncbi:MAG: Fic family protein [Coriobacteriia bacterium]